MNKKVIIGLVVAVVIIIVAIVGFAIYQNTKTEEDNSKVENTELGTNTDNTNVNSEDTKNTDNSSNGSKTLVVYYSAQNHTKAVSEKIAKNLNADIFEIEPEEKYTTEDLNWTNDNSRVSFVKANDFSGKTVIPFCTSASSGLGQSGRKFY